MSRDRFLQDVTHTATSEVQRAVATWPRQGLARQDRCAVHAGAVDRNTFSARSIPMVAGCFVNGFRHRAAARSALPHRYRRRWHSRASAGARAPSRFVSSGCALSIVISPSFVCQRAIRASRASRGRDFRLAPPRSGNASRQPPGTAAVTRNARGTVSSGSRRSRRKTALCLRHAVIRRARGAFAPLVRHATPPLGLPQAIRDAAANDRAGRRAKRSVNAFFTIACEHCITGQAGMPLALGENAAPVPQRAGSPFS